MDDESAENANADVGSMVAAVGVRSAVAGKWTADKSAENAKVGSPAATGRELTIESLAGRSAVVGKWIEDKSAENANIGRALVVE